MYVCMYVCITVFTHIATGKNLAFDLPIYQKLQ
jgi:hypothetical protein